MVSTCPQVHNSPAMTEFCCGQKTKRRFARMSRAADTAHPRQPFRPLERRSLAGDNTGLCPGGHGADQTGGCGSCHRAHGWPDPAHPAATTEPAVEREENLCYTCHDGSPVTKNLRANFTKTYRHPVALPVGTRLRRMEFRSLRCGQPAFGVYRLPQPASLAADTTPRPPAAPVRCVAWPGFRQQRQRDSVIIRSWRERSTTVKEYEVSFTCHSGWTTRPAASGYRQVQYRIAFIPSRRERRQESQHQRQCFCERLRATSPMSCTDCHTSDTRTSAVRMFDVQYILKKLAVASAAGAARRCRARALLRLPPL